MGLVVSELGRRALARVRMQPDRVPHDQRHQGHRHRPAPPRPLVVVIVERRHTRFVVKVVVKFLPLFRRSGANAASSASVLGVFVNLAGVVKGVVFVAESQGRPYVLLVDVVLWSGVALRKVVGAVEASHARHRRRRALEGTANDGLLRGSRLQGTRRRGDDHVVRRVEPPHARLRRPGGALERPRDEQLLRRRRLVARPLVSTRR